MKDFNEILREFKVAKKERKFDRMICGIRVSQEMYNRILMLKINPTEVMRMALEKEIAKKSKRRGSDHIFYE